MEATFTPTKQPAHERLYNLSKRRASHEQLTQPSPQRTGPRHPIEFDLLTWHEKKEAKIRLARTQQAKKELGQVTAVPEINALSREILKLSDASERVRTTQVCVANTLRVKKAEPTSLSTPSLKVDLSKMSHSHKEVPRPQKPLLPKHTSMGLSYESITELLKSNSDVQLTVAERQLKYSQLHSPISDRTQVWKETSRCKTQKSKDLKAEHELDGCTFHPDLSKGPPPLERRVSEPVLPLQYNQLSASNKKAGYSIGFNFKRLTSKAKPMLAYNAVVRS